VVVIGRGAEAAAAEAFTDSLKRGGRDVYVDLNAGLAGRHSVSVDVSYRMARHRARMGGVGVKR
jgi:hypothetical protein